MGNTDLIKTGFKIKLFCLYIDAVFLLCAKSGTSKDLYVIFCQFIVVFDFQNSYACAVTAVINSTERRWVIRIASILLLPKKALFLSF